MRSAVITVTTVITVAAGVFAPGHLGELTRVVPFELEVLTLVGRGLSNTEMASALTLSEATVKTHLARILTKLRLRDRVQAVVLAYETGLVKPGLAAEDS